MGILIYKEKNKGKAGKEEQVVCNSDRTCRRPVGFAIGAAEPFDDIERDFRVDLISYKIALKKIPGKTREEILNLLTQNKHQLENRFKVHRMALFGSYARGDQQSDGDVDIPEDTDPSVGLELVALAEQIEQLLDLPVGLVSRRAIKPNKLKFIEQDLIYV
jgi:predicted nucleotidyltransferase